jgi:hypothetical protein
MRCFTADFETTTKVDDCRVWAYAICEIGDPDNFQYGNSLDDFMEWCAYDRQNFKVYFHNLKFDGEFILWWLLDNGFEWVNDKKDRHDKSFTTLITDMGAWYSIEVYFKCYKSRVNKVTFYDSLKILNFSVAQIAEDFNLPIKKLELDYKSDRPKGHILTPHEVDYIRNDVEIMARALDYMFNDAGLTKMTIGSDALSDFKSRCKSFKQYFPELDLETDAEIRLSYKGGFTYLCDNYLNAETGGGVTFDVNSMYPAKMVQEYLPIGYPERFEGKYEPDPLYNLFVQQLTCSFDIKPGFIPTIQLKRNMSFMPNEYIKSTHGELVTLTLASPDLELFFKHYDVDNIVYHGGFKFKSCKGLFDEYINYWTEQKINAKKEGNGAKTRTAKLMLNSLYGKFGLNPRGAKKAPYIGDDETVHQMMLEVEERKPIYIPVATFITAYARKYIIESGQKMREWTIKNKGFDGMAYFDTDSMHVIGIDEDDVKELSKDLNIDDYELGAWKLESKFVRAKYIRQKCYIEQGEDGVINVTVAGFPKKLSHLVTFDNFNLGFSTLNFTDEEIGEAGRKLTYKHVKGGVILADTDFTIK